MAIPELFTSESLYTSDQWFVHDIVDSGEHHLVGICDTSELASHPLVLAQRPWSGHPKHLPGAIMLQITGTLGNIHTVTVLNLRMTEGWVGFGTNILDARFRGLGLIGPPLRCELKVEELRELKGQLFVTYAFRFSQEGRAIYKSRQRASWLRADPSAPEPA